MDRNSTIGLVLIGLIITVFSVMNQPSDADIKAAQKKEATEQKSTAAKAKTKNETAVAPVPSATSAQVAKKGTPTIIENEQLRLELNSKGGIVAAAYLKNYKSYKDFAAKKDAALCLFKDGDAYNQLVIGTKNGKLFTRNYLYRTICVNHTVRYACAASEAVLIWEDLLRAGLTTSPGIRRTTSSLFSSKQRQSVLMRRIAA